MILYYKLDENKNPVPCDLEGFKDVFATDRTVKQEQVGDKWVSTIFLSIDHNFLPRELSGDHRPILFETMVFNQVEGEPDSTCYQERYHTYQEALDGHNAVVDKLKHGVSLDAYEEF